MEDRVKSQVNEPANGEGPATPAGEAPREEVDNLAGEAAAAYEKARREMNEALARLRSEINKIDLEQARTRARGWVDENPTLAVFLAVGAGLVAGRLLAHGLRPAPPPPFPVRARLKAEHLARHAQDYAGEMGGLLAAQAALAARQAVKASEALSEKTGRTAGDLARRAADWSEDLVDRAETLGGRLGEQADVVTARLTQAASEAAHDASGAFKKQSKQLKKKAKRGIDVSESLVDSARTILAAVVINKVNDWFRGR